MCFISYIIQLITQQNVKVNPDLSARHGPHQQKPSDINNVPASLRHTTIKRILFSNLASPYKIENSTIISALKREEF